jgi:hypothetical protein
MLNVILIGYLKEAVLEIEKEFKVVEVGGAFGKDYFTLTHAGFKKEGEAYPWLAQSASQAIKYYIRQLRHLISFSDKQLLIWRDPPSLEYSEAEDRMNPFTKDPIDLFHRPEFYTIYSRLWVSGID